MMWFALTAGFAFEPVEVDPPEAVGSEWSRRFYARPRGNVRAIRVGDRTGALALVGAEGGVRYARTRDGRPDLLGRTRVLGDVMYGLLSNASGYQVRLGSFIGPTGKVVTYQVGPDFWGNQYGNPASLDFHLPFSLGVDLSNVVIFHIDPQVSAQIGVSPGWAFNRARQVGRIGPFHELNAFVALAVRTRGFGFVVGYQRTWNAAGATDGLILSGGF